MIGCFIVGCPRSGTTLLQSMLGAHSKVFSLTESHERHLIQIPEALRRAMEHG